MFGPLVVRELLTAPQHLKHFALRAGYVAFLCVLIYTGAQTTSGYVPLRGVGEIARFGSFIFSLICSVQLALVFAASLLLSAGSVAMEKDRRTLILLLMTDLRATELVLGKTFAGLVPVFLLVAISFPVLCLIRMLGGVTLGQVVWVEVLCLVSALAAGSWGTLVGYWREKTFQILAVTFMGAGLFLGLAEVLASLGGENPTLLGLSTALNPFRALHQVLNPLTNAADVAEPSVQAWGTVIGLSLTAVIFWTIGCLYVRIWNPTRVVHLQVPETEETAEAATEGEAVAAEEFVTAPAREVWQQPVLWREICTQAYGRKIGIIKLAYYLFALFCILWVNRAPVDAPRVLGFISVAGFAFVMLSLVGLMLVNAQAVTSLTSERDGQTLELLLVTEVSAKEFIFGKLGGIFFNTKEVIAVPLLFAILTYFQRGLSLESLFYVVTGYLTLVCFAAMLGLHAGLTFWSSRSAISNSLGTMFFLFVGIFICMMLIVEARSSFEFQLIPFLVFILGGSLGLWGSLNSKAHSTALLLCAWTLPFMTFYAITSYLLPEYLFAYLAIVMTYGFTTIAMLIPAVSAFDVALGRTTIDK